MSKKIEAIHYALSLGDDDIVTIESEECVLSSEYIADKSVKRKTMNPAKILFAAFAL